ncbi:Inosine/xanthosine triphosphatase [Candidatus Lokiarchaeum ossiferum]|uniref:Probable inosine/xanthosine triphosphatase n=1 Tax=Candidatus Lokiarchaeum ossiferum TaxID=2951803 RepID=A0ABY6HSL6_9ARCH|nr:Inosine/xanthosine triphosphatase [Candidatus Lokiarchaeum sp. B-35]
MLVFVGSTNPVKINATKIEFEHAFPQESIKVVGIKVKSNVADQPIGLEKVTQGAINRAKNVMQEAKKDYLSEFSFHNEIFAVGIEAGFVPIPSSISGYLDFQFCAIVNSEDRLSLSSGSGLDFPPKVVKLLLDNPQIELGDVMGQLSGDKNIKHKEGAIGFYSQGRITRTDITRQGVQMALIPFINKKEYFNG